ncbi:MAG: hypothetical protein FWH15_06710 [Betaproteobacteria bacterium]|nr:hypothetical protein [Betaproteobacteria bacterium]
MARIRRGEPACSPKGQTHGSAPTGSAHTSGAPDDLAVLAPGHRFMAGGEKLTMRPFNFGEQIQYAEPLSDFLEALQPALAASDDRAVSLMIRAMEANAGTLLPLAVVCCGKTTDWALNLDSDGGESVLWAFWWANHVFFHLRLCEYPEISRKYRAEILGGARSSQPSSGTDTAQAI